MATEVPLKVITPNKTAIESDVISITAPSAEGEVTVLARHEPFLTLLKEGILTIRRHNKEDELLAIGGGYLETNGKQITVLVSRAYGQDEVDEASADKAAAEAKKILETTKDVKEQEAALSALRRSQIDLSLVRKHKKRPSVVQENS